MQHLKDLSTTVSIVNETKKIDECSANLATGGRLKLLQFKALIYKRFLRTRRDWRLMISGLVLPCLFVALAMACNIIAPRYGSYSKLELSPELYGSAGAVFFR